MRKAELIERTAAQADLSKRDAEAAVDALFEHITNALSRGEAVAIAGFGTFSVKTRAARTGRNPQTGQAIAIPASNAPAFKPGINLKTKLAQS